MQEPVKQLTPDEAAIVAQQMADAEALTSHPPKQLDRPKMVPMKLLRNYRPGGPVEIVGWHKPAVTRKDNTGRAVEISPAEFVKGEGGPPPYPGVGFPEKIWAGTVIKLTEDEAKSVKRLGIAELEFAD